MRVASIEIRNFRNHTETLMQCAEGINAIVGDNGQGKTNIIEAISYLCLTKSFYATSDAVVLQIGKEDFSLRGSFRADNGVTRRIDARYDKATGRKAVEINSAPVEVLSSMIGEFPLVVLSPEQNGITFGAPTERRKFLDLVIAQASKVYLRELLEYRRILRQRNKILLDAKLARRDCSDLLEPWNESLIETGSNLMHRRWAFVQGFTDNIVEAHRRIAGDEETPEMYYQPSFNCSSMETLEGIRRGFKEDLQTREEEERRTGVTAIGPHRDEIEFRLNGMNVRKFASQGQHKTLLVALKLAEFGFLREQCQETPLLLLDDVFSELDSRRSERMVHEVREMGQVFVTATDLRAFPGRFSWDGVNRRFIVTEGNLAIGEAKGHAHAAAGNSN